MLNVKTTYLTLAVAGMTCISLPSPAQAIAAVSNTEANITPTSPLACIALETDSLRLACYDSLFIREPINLEPSSNSKQIVSEPTTLSFKQKAQQKSAQNTSSNTPTTPNNRSDTTLETNPMNTQPSFLDHRWELSNQSKLGLFNLRANRPVYILPVFYNATTNTSYGDPSHVEAKFQLSAKTKVVENIFKNNGDIWLGYTQASHWQVFTPSHSRPFRETNYEPEASLVFRTNYNIFGWDGRLLGVTLNHQSNGGSTESSRSWNRVIGKVGLEKDNWIVMLSPWLRIQEANTADDNPIIEDYIGRGEIQIVRKGQLNEISLMLRHSLKANQLSRGAIELDWTYTLNKSLRGYVQVFHGYGESLIDYDQRTTAVGLGIALVNWY